MAIQVSVSENTVVSNAVINEKNSLVITLSQGVVMDEFEAMESGASMDSNTVNIMYFPQDNTWYGKDGSAKELTMKFRALTHKLTEAIKFQHTGEIKWNMFKDTGITNGADIAAKITDAAVCEKIGHNIFTKFVELVAASEKTPCRMRLVRQSAAKHFPTLPESLLFKKDGGEWTVDFTESMSIPKEQSKNVYTKKEIEKGLHIADKVVADSAPDTAPFEL